MNRGTNLFMNHFTYLQKLTNSLILTAISLSIIACSTTDKLTPKASQNNADANESKISAGQFKYKIGDVGPAGGWIFFVDRFNEYPAFDYLEAAPDAASPSIVWATSTTTCYDESDSPTNCQSGSIYPKAERDGKQLLSTNVGMGSANTKAIIARHNAGAVPKTEYAAGLADSYSTKVGNAVFNDWFLPSAGEEKLMYTNLEQASVVKFAHYDNWSSSEVESDSAWYPEYFSGVRTGANKFFTNSVRAIRAF